MSTSINPEVSKPRLSLRSALWVILLIWLAYTILYTLNSDNAPSAFLEFLPGILGVATLAAAGFSIEACHLRLAPISKTGLILLGASLLLMPMVWFTGSWIGWDWTAALVYAPASGISQELFFRATLLPICLATFKTKPFLAVLLHALLFAAWHIPKASMTAPLGGVIGVVLVTFACGLLWGEQVRRDRTVVWLMGVHSLILIINSFLTWG